MTTSNSTTWELTRNDIIDAALRKLAVLGEGESANATQLITGQTALNGVIARFNTLGMPLWKRQQASVTLIDGTDTYVLNTALKLAEVYIRVISSTVTWKLEPKSEYDIRNLPYGSTGIPNCYSFTPNLAEGGTLRVWPIPDSSTAASYNLWTIYQEELDTFTSAGETPDFPAYWTDAIIYATAVALAPEYSIPLNDRAVLRTEAKDYLDQAKGYSDEDGSIMLQPYPRRY